MRNPFRSPKPEPLPLPHEGPRQVRMLRTVWSQEREYLAYQVYNLTDAKADEFIVNGYATGDLSREWTPDEIAALVNRNIEVKL